jgi:hypothetical protein
MSTNKIKPVAIGGVTSIGRVISGVRQADLVASREGQEKEEKRGEILE